MPSVSIKIVHLNRTLLMEWEGDQARGSDLKQSIVEAEPQLNVENIRLIISGREIPDDALLSTFSFHNETLVHLVMRQTPVTTTPTPTTTSSSSSRRTSSTSTSGSSSSSSSSNNWQRPQWAPLEVRTHDLPLLPTNWASFSFYISCVGCTHKPLVLDSVTQPQEIQQGVVRPICGECSSQAVEIPAGQPISWLDVFQDNIQGACFSCAEIQAEAQVPRRRRTQDLQPLARRIKFVFHCRGDRAEALVLEDGTTRSVCRSSSADALVVPLPNVEFNPTGEESIDQMVAESVQVVFHPCRCRYSLPGFIGCLDRLRRGMGGSIGVEGLRSGLVRNSQHPTVFGEYVTRCLSPRCSGIAYLPTCRVLPQKLRNDIKEWATVEHVLQNGGVLCSSCQTAFFAANQGPRQACPACSISFCEQHNLPWDRCPHTTTEPAIPTSRPISQEFTEFFRIRIESIMTRGSMCKQPCCDIPIGIKDENCTHITCPQHGKWCYFCEQPCDWGHERDWQTNPERCPLYLHHHPDCAGTPNEALAKFHRWRTIRFLCEQRNQSSKWKWVFDRLYPQLPASLVTLNEDWNGQFIVQHPITLDEIKRYGHRRPTFYRMP